MVVGKHPLENFLQVLSKNVPLSMKYTNHSIRPTGTGSLDEAGFDAHHIRAVSGHHSDETIKCNVHKWPPKKNREICDTLSEKVGIQKPKKKKAEAT